jgi:hypothetical protein
MLTIIFTAMWDPTGNLVNTRDSGRVSVVRPSRWAPEYMNQVICTPSQPAHGVNTEMNRQVARRK